MTSILRLTEFIWRHARNSFLRWACIGSGAAALLWFLLRVIPKPSRVAYPCQRAAFPAASAFVIWLWGVLAIKSSISRLGRRLGRHRIAMGCLGALTILGLAGWTLVSYTDSGVAAGAAASRTDWNFIPAKPNEPVGIARGINPGRVVWAHDPQAAKWAGHWKQKSDQWWLDANTDQERVDAMLNTTLLKLTSAPTAERAWEAIFEYYCNSHGLAHRGYQPGEVVAVKINLNSSDDGAKTDNYIDASPQMVLAMVRQLVNQAHVRQQDVLVYDARKAIPAYMLKKVWSEFQDVRFVQLSPPKATQPKNPGYGDYHGLETAIWVEGIAYSKGKYNEAKLIPQQVFDAAYLINLALLKGHSYPYNTMEDGDSGQTGVTLCGKNHFGSIKGTWELHAAINTDQEGVKNAYSPMVDLAASPHLGAKTILFVLDGLYCGRKWQSYPQHFPNPPFNNRAEPYENSDWPASVLASLDGVALDSVGLDILFAQTKNNNDTNGHPRILIRANADDYLFELAQPDHCPSGTAYVQNGKPVTSLGVHERWDSDATKRYSRNLDPVNGKGIELVYLPSGPASAILSSSAPEGWVLIKAKGQSFQMGQEFPGRRWTYTFPAHRVSFTYDFMMEATQVTQAEYKKVAGVNPTKHPGDDRRPIDNVSWFDAVLYCNALSKRDGLDAVYAYSDITRNPTNHEVADLSGLTIDIKKNGYRLLTSAEYEYVVRAGTTTTWFFGDSNANQPLATNFAWCELNAKDKATHPVGQLKPNAFGVYDITGNLWMWCNDWYDGAYPETPQVDPTGPASGKERIARGGAFKNDVAHERSAYHWQWPPQAHNFEVGFRIARTVYPASGAAHQTLKALEAKENSTDLRANDYVAPFDPAAAGLTRLFDGKTLNGWVGDPECWKVIDGAIVGVKGNQNIMTVGDYDDFRIIISTRQVKEPSNHQGVGFWGEHMPEGKYGYGGCVDVMPPMNWTWDYTVNRGAPGKLSISRDLDKELGIKRSQWTQAEILVNRAKGTIRMAVNGIEMLYYTDDNPGRLKKGPIGLQAHGGNRDVRYKDIFIEVAPKEDRLITLKK